MNKRSSDSAWRIEAIKILEAYSINPGKKSLTQVSLAKELGIARQTLWRDEEIKTRMRSIQRGLRKSVRRSKELRVTELEYRNRTLVEENGLLLQNLILAAKNLRDRGLDPYEYFAESLLALKSAFPGVTGSMVYADLKT